MSSIHRSPQHTYSPHCDHCTPPKFNGLTAEQYDSLLTPEHDGSIVDICTRPFSEIGLFFRRLSSYLCGDTPFLTDSDLVIRLWCYVKNRTETNEYHTRVLDVYTAFNNRLSLKIKNDMKSKLEAIGKFIGTNAPDPIQTPANPPSPTPKAPETPSPRKNAEASLNPSAKVVPSTPPLKEPEPPIAKQPMSPSPRRKASDSVDKKESSTPSPLEQPKPAIPKQEVQTNPLPASAKLQTVSSKSPAGQGLTKPAAVETSKSVQKSRLGKIPKFELPRDLVSPFPFELWGLVQEFKNDKRIPYFDLTDLKISSSDGVTTLNREMVQKFPSIVEDNIKKLDLLVDQFRSNFINRYKNQNELIKSCFDKFDQSINEITVHLLNSSTYMKGLKHALERNGYVITDKEFSDFIDLRHDPYKNLLLAMNSIENEVGIEKSITAYIQNILDQIMVIDKTSVKPSSASVPTRQSLTEKIEVVLNYFLSRNPADYITSGKGKMGVENPWFEKLFLQLYKRQSSDLIGPQHPMNLSTGIGPYLISSAEDKKLLLNKGESGKKMLAVGIYANPGAHFLSYVRNTDIEFAILNNLDNNTNYKPISGLLAEWNQALEETILEINLTKVPKISFPSAHQWVIPTWSNNNCYLVTAFVRLATFHFYYTQLLKAGIYKP